MKTWMSVQVTISEVPCLNNARVYFSDDELNLELSYTTDYEQGMKELRKLERRLGKVAELVINRFDSKIAYKELHGYIDRE